MVPTSNNNTDSCEFYSRYIKTIKYKGVALREYITDKDIVAESLHDWLTEYAVVGISEACKKELRTKVLGNTFYLILHEIKSWNLIGNIFEEAVQNACIAVVGAMDQFDLSRNVKFTTFLIQCHVIKTAIRNTIEDNSVVRIPSGVRKRTATKAKALLLIGEEPDTVPFGSHIVSLDTGEAPPTEDLVEETDDAGEDDDGETLDETETQGSFAGSQYIEDVDYTRYGDKSEQYDVDNQVFVKQVKKMCELALCTDMAGLTENEKVTLKHKHGLLNAPVLRNKEIVGVLRAQGTDVSEPRICQYNKNGMAKMKRFLRSYA